MGVETEKFGENYEITAKGLEIPDRGLHIQSYREPRNSARGLFKGPVLIWVLTDDLLPSHAAELHGSVTRMPSSILSLMGSYSVGFTVAVAALLAQSQLHRQEAGQRCAWHNKYYMASITTAVP